MIDWAKPVRTKGSKTPVKILSLQGPGDMSVVGYLMDGETDICQWYPGGGYSVDPEPSDMDLENVPEAACPFEIFAAFKEGWEAFDSNRYIRETGRGGGDDMKTSFAKSRCYANGIGKRVTPNE